MKVIIRTVIQYETRVSEFAVREVGYSEDGTPIVVYEAVEPSEYYIVPD